MVKEESSWRQYAEEYDVNDVQGSRYHISSIYRLGAYFFQIISLPGAFTGPALFLGRCLLFSFKVFKLISLFDFKE